MEIEQSLLVLAFFMVFLDFVVLLKVKPRQKKKLEYGSYAATIGFGLIVISYFLLVQGFLTDDFSLKQVYSCSSSTLPALSKVYATWAGAGGSLLLLTLLIGIVYLAYRFRTYGKSSALSVHTSRMLSLFVLFFLLVTVIKNPFERFSSMPPDGLGLNPSLQTFWMIIHPPIVFSAYALILLGFALTLASMKTREHKEHGLLKFSLQGAWALLALGIALGGIWAYQVLGWGGYWAWDPVETASLLVWLALTAYFHLGPLANEKGLTRETMILTSFAALIFLSALTRGGIRQSVHAYALSPAGPILLFFALSLGVYFFYLKRTTHQPILSLTVEKSSLYSVSLLIGFVSLAFAFIVSFSGIVYPIIMGFFTANPPVPTEGFYYTWNFPFVVAFVAGLIGCSLYQKVHFKGFLSILIGSIATGVVFTQIQFPTSNILANLGFPVLIVGLVSTAFKLGKSLSKSERTLRQFSRSILHFGVIVTLIGVFLSVPNKQVSVITDARPNSTVETLGLSVVLRDFTRQGGAGAVYSQQWEGVIPESSALSMQVDVRQGANVYSGTLWAYLYPNYGLIAAPLIITTSTGDIYMHVGFTQSMNYALWQSLVGNETAVESFILTVELVPMVYLVWIGVSLLIIGVAIPLIAEIAMSQIEKEIKQTKLAKPFPSTKSARNWHI